MNTVNYFCCGLFHHFLSTAGELLISLPLAGKDKATQPISEWYSIWDRDLAWYSSSILFKPCGHLGDASFIDSGPSVDDIGRRKELVGEPDPRSPGSPGYVQLNSY